MLGILFNWVLFMLIVIYTDCHLCWVPLMFSVAYAECCSHWVSFMLSFIYAEWHLCKASFMIGLIYADCHLCSLSLMVSVIMLCAIYAEFHLCWVSYMLSLINAKCHWCWVWHISHLCLVPLCWVSRLRLWPLAMKPFRISSCSTFKKYVSTSVGPSPSKLPQLGPISRKMSLPIPGKGRFFSCGEDSSTAHSSSANWSTANSSTGL